MSKSSVVPSGKDFQGKFKNMNSRQLNIVQFSYGTLHKNCLDRGTLT